MINETMPVKKPSTCILPAPCLSECLPESTVVQVLVQRAHRQCVVADTILDFMDLHHTVTVAASVSSAIGLLTLPTSPGKPALGRSPLGRRRRSVSRDFEAQFDGASSMLNPGRSGL